MSFPHQVQNDRKYGMRHARCLYLRYNPSNMKIGVDAAVLATNKYRAGNFILSYKLLSNLSKIDNSNQYILYSFSPIPKKILHSLGKNFTNLVLHPQKFWLQLRLSLEQIIRPVDVFLGLNQALPFLTLSQSVVVVLDLAFEVYPETFHNAPKLSWQTKRAVEKANKIIAISQSTKKDLLNLYKINSRRIELIYPG